MNKITIEINGQSQEFPLTERNESNPFKTGSRGFNVMGKLQFGEKKYQVGVNIVEIGSKPKV